VLIVKGLYRSDYIWSVVQAARAGRRTALTFLVMLPEQAVQQIDRSFRAEGQLPQNLESLSEA
jgi:hypothetical protein